MSFRKTADGVFRKADVAAAMTALAKQEIRAALVEAASDNDAPKLRQLLDDHPGLLHMQDDAGWTLLHTAVGWCAVEAAEELLNRGAEADRADRDGQTPRELAHRLGFGLLAEIMDDAPARHEKEKEAEQVRARAARAALKEEILAVTHGLPAPCCVHKRPLRLRH